MKTKNIEKARFRGTEGKKNTQGEARGNEHCHYVRLFLGVSLTVICFMLLLVGMGVVSATDYVIVSGNDNIAVQNAIDSLGPGGGTVIIPAGTYTFYNKVDVPANVTIQGEGRDKTIIYNDNGGDQAGYEARSAGAGKAAFATMGNNARYTAMHIIGPPILDPYGTTRNYDYEGYGIYVAYKTNIRIDHCELNSFAMNAIYIDNAGCLVDHNYIHNNYKRGVGYGVNARGHSNGKTFIEDNSFGFNRHDVGAGGEAHYVARYNYIKSETTRGAQTSSFDAHESTIEGEVVEWYNNIIEGDQSAGEPYGAFHPRGCTAIIFNNVVAARDSVNAAYAPSLIYYWNNDISGVWGYEFSFWEVEPFEIHMHPPDGYVPDPYPHPLNDDPSKPIDGYGHFSSVAGKGTITGTVKDNDTGNPVEGAIVSVDSYSVTTNSAGEFTITLLAGTYTVTASKTGHQSQSQSNIRVLEDQTTTVNFQLTQLLINNLNKYTTKSDFDNGAVLYSDRGYVASSVPIAYQGLEWIQTQCNDKWSTGDSWLTFDVSEYVTVYVGYPTIFISDGHPEAPWLDDGTWIDTGEEFEGFCTMRLYRKTFSQGSVTLGGNYGNEDTPMYVVLVGQGEPPNVYIRLEAEDADEINPLMEIASNPSASNGKYVWVPDESGRDGPGYARYTIDITTPGYYKICGRAQAPTVAGNSFFVQMDDNPNIIWDTTVTDSWVWDDVSQRGSGEDLFPEIDPAIFTLSAGKHVLTIKHRESGTKLDRLLITNDLTFVPQADTTPPVADAGQDQTVDRDTVVYFDGSGSTDNVGIRSYSWDFDATSDGIQIDATGVTASHIYTEPGTYIVTLTVTDTSNNTDTDTCMVTVNATSNRAPVLNTIGDKSIDEGFLLEFTISASDPDGDPLTYSANNLPAGATFDPATRTFSWTPDYGQEGTYPNVHFEVTDGHLTDAEDITITVNNATTVHIRLEAEDADEINPLMEIASDPSAYNNSYIWVPDGGGWKGPGYVRYIITITTPGDYKICGRVQAPTIANNSFLVRMDDDPDRTWTIPVTAKWGWDEVNHWGSGTETDPEIDPVIFTLSTGEHVLTIKHRESGTKLDRLLITNELTFVPHVPDTTPPVADAGQDQTVDNDTVVYFDGSGSTDDIGIKSYSWDFDASDDIRIDATGVTASHTYTEPGSYIVTLTVTDTFENTDTDTCMVMVNAPRNQMASHFGVNDTSGISGTYMLVPVNIVDVTNGPIQTVKFDILYNESVLSLNSNDPKALQPGTLTDAGWWFMLGSNDHSITLTTAWQSLTIPDGSAGSVVLLNFSVIGAPGATSYMDISEIEFATTENELGTAPAESGLFSVLRLGTISGTIAYSCNRTTIAGAVVNLTKNGSLISSTTTDANGMYTFTDIEPGDYDVRVSKIHFWDNSTSATTYIDPETVSDLVLLLRGDLNDNGKIADAEDVNRMIQVFNRDIPGNKYFDLNENGVIVDFGDVEMILQASIGELIL